MNRSERMAAGWPNARFVTHAGQTRSLSGWARVLGVSVKTIQWRLGRWDIARALSAPPRKQRYFVHHCGYCGAPGHNIRRCPEPKR